MNLLDEIIASKRIELETLRLERPLDALREEARAVASRPPFASALRAAPMGLIAEVKRRSPSAGAIREQMDAGETAADYAAAGAHAISVLMDGKYFGGGEADMKEVRSSVHLPLLYKEFVVDAWQVWHAASLGASVVLLIVAALERGELEALMAVCGEAGLETLVEVHTAEEMRVAREVGAPCVGINNRDLKTFTVTVESSLRLREEAPPECTLISESGIRAAEDVVRLRDAGIHGVLVGEHLLRQADLRAAVRELMGEAWGSL